MEEVLSIASYLRLMRERLRCDVGDGQGHIVSQFELGILRDRTPELLAESGDFFLADRSYTDEEPVK